MEPPVSSYPDPLARYSALALFPRTLPAYRTPDNGEDMESLHAYLKSKALDSPQKHLEQAMSVVNKSSGSLNSKISNSMPFEEDNLSTAVGSGSRDNAKTRRPALGRKKARFSLMVEKSQPGGKHEDNLDIDKLQDPEEYFLAYERLENAKKELQKQRGNVVSDLDDHEPAATTMRRRRPDFMGRKASYKHLYSSVVPDNDASSLSSQNTAQDVSANNINDIVQQESTSKNMESYNVEVTDPITKTETRAGGLLDDLLSGKHGDLDDGFAISIMRECLQIKPIDIDKLCLPELHDVRRDAFVSGENISGRRGAMADLQNVLKGYRKTSDVSADQSSNTPPKSPFSKISLLRKLVLDANTSLDPFSVSNIELSPKKSFSRDGAHDQCDPVDTAEDFVISRKSMDISHGGPLLLDEHVAGASMDAPAVLSTESCSKIDDVNFTELQHDVVRNAEVFNGKETTIENHSTGTMINFDAQIDTHPEINNKISEFPGACEASIQPLEIMHSNTEELDAHDGCLDQSKHVASETASEGSLVNANGSTDQRDKVAYNLPLDLSTHKVNKEGAKRGRKRKEHSGTQDPIAPGQSSSAAVPTIEEHASSSPLPRDVEYVEDPPPVTKGKRAKRKGTKKQPSRTRNPPPAQSSDSSPAKVHATVDERVKEHSGVTRVESRHLERGPKRKGVFSGRQSLAGAGIKWESGVRRSTRIRMRPLQYWKGERFIYGRLHQSLATVIGVKYVCVDDGDEGNATIKVESYVPDEYSELVELSAFH